jgi:hypothetical protein
MAGSSITVALYTDTAFLWLEEESAIFEKSDIMQSEEAEELVIH